MALMFRPPEGNSYQEPQSIWYKVDGEWVKISKIFTNKAKLEIDELKQLERVISERRSPINSKIRDLKTIKEFASMGMSAPLSVEQEKELTDLMVKRDLLDSSAISIGETISTQSYNELMGLVNPNLEKEEHKKNMLDIEALITAKKLNIIDVEKEMNNVEAQARTMDEIRTAMESNKSLKLLRVKPIGSLNMRPELYFRDVNYDKYLGGFYYKLVDTNTQTIADTKLNIISSLGDKVSFTEVTYNNIMVEGLLDISDKLNVTQSKVNTIKTQQQKIDVMLPEITLFAKENPDIQLEIEAEPLESVMAQIKKHPELKRERLVNTELGVITTEVVVSNEDNAISLDIGKILIDASTPTTIADIKVTDQKTVDSKLRIIEIEKELNTVVTDIDREVTPIQNEIVNNIGNKTLETIVETIDVVKLDDTLLKITPIIQLTQTKFKTMQITKSEGILKNSLSADASDLFAVGYSASDILTLNTKLTMFKSAREAFEFIISMYEDSVYNIEEVMIEDTCGKVMNISVYESVLYDLESNTTSMNGLHSGVVSMVSSTIGTNSSISSKSNNISIISNIDNDKVIVSETPTLSTWHPKLSIMDYSNVHNLEETLNELPRLKPYGLKIYNKKSFNRTVSLKNKLLFDTKNYRITRIVTPTTIKSVSTNASSMFGIVGSTTAQHKIIVNTNSNKTSKRLTIRLRESFETSRIVSQKPVMVSRLQLPLTKDFISTYKFSIGVNSNVVNIIESQSCTIGSTDRIVLMKALLGNVMTGQGLLIPAMNGTENNIYIITEKALTIQDNTNFSELSVVEPGVSPRIVSQINTIGNIVTSESISTDASEFDKPRIVNTDWANRVRINSDVDVSPEKQSRIVSQNKVVVVSNFDEYVNTTIDEYEPQEQQSSIDVS